MATGWRRLSYDLTFAGGSDRESGLNREEIHRNFTVREPSNEMSHSRRCGVGSEMGNPLGRQVFRLTGGESIQLWGSMCRWGTGSLWVVEVC
jgi:hypothetical protein